MIVVSDTTPLISLMKIGKLELVRQLFGEARIPGAVYAEFSTHQYLCSRAGSVKMCRERSTCLFYGLYDKEKDRKRLLQ